MDFAAKTPRRDASALSEQKSSPVLSSSFERDEYLGTQGEYHNLPEISLAQRAVRQTRFLNLLYIQGGESRRSSSQEYNRP